MAGSARSLVEPQDIDGYWRVPSRRRELPGTLQFRPESGLELRLKGSFTDELTELTDDPESLPVILGRTQQDRRVTLFGCSRSGGQISFPGYPTSHYTADIGAIGPRWLNSNRQLKFRRFDVSYQSLDEFAGPSGIRIDLEALRRQEPGLKYQRSPRISFRIEEYEMTVVVQWWTRGAEETREQSIGEQAWLRVTANARKAVDDVVNGPLRTVRDLLELAGGQPAAMFAIRGVEIHRRDEAGQARIPDETEILLSQSAPLGLRRLRRGQFAFTLDQVAGVKTSAASGAIARWHQAKKRLGPVIDLFFSIARMQRLPTEHAFLLLAHAVESYHRRTWPVGKRAVAKHRRRVGRIISRVESEPDKEWLQRVLRFSGEQNLRRRLMDVYTAMPEEGQRLLGKRNDFCHQVLVTRNYLTHFDKRLRKKALSGTELWRAVYKLKYILRVLLLRELGLTEVDKLAEHRLLERFQTESRD